jgi:predicted small integral membrane protein
LSVKAGEVGLVEDFLDLYWVGVVVQDRWMALSVKKFLDSRC